MKHAVLAATTALTLMLGGPAFAESNNVASVEAPQAPSVVRGGGGSQPGGSEAYPSFNAAMSVPVTAGDGLLLPSNGSEGIVQTAASLPRGFWEGTLAYAQAQSVGRFLAGREERARLVAQQAGGSHRG